jgi:hypothetical protein
VRSTEIHRYVDVMRHVLAHYICMYYKLLNSSEQEAILAHCMFRFSIMDYIIEDMYMQSAKVSNRLVAFWLGIDC